MAYAVNENYPSVSVLSGLGREMRLEQVADTMPAEYLAKHPNAYPEGGVAPHDGTHRMRLSEVSPSDIRVSADGRFVYVSNRSCANPGVPGSIAVFNVLEHGKLVLAQVYEVDDRNPRGLALTCDGRYLLVAGMQHGVVSAYNLDEATGQVMGLAGRAAVSAAASVTIVTRD